MYDLIDRPVTQLAPGGRFMLWAMRGWIHAASHGSCPPGALAPAFAKHDVLPALPHLHMLLAELNRNATRKLAFAPLSHGCIGDDEAVLLQLCRDALVFPQQARETLGLLVDEDSVENAFCALVTMVQRLEGKSLARVSLAKDGIVDPR